MTLQSTIRGFPFADFSRLSLAQKRGILAQQTICSDDPAWFKCWNADFNEPPETTPYLLVETFVSEASRVRFQRLARAWCSDGLDAAQLRALTSEMGRDAFVQFRELETTGFGRS